MKKDLQMQALFHYFNEGGDSEWLINYLYILYPINVIKMWTVS